MGILSRVRRLLQANIHEMLDRAEDPVKMANALVRDMQDGIELAREETAKAMAGEKRLARQAEEANNAAEQWQQRARLAVARGDDELAREALRRRNAAEELATQYHRAHQEQVEVVTQLRRALTKLEQKLHEAKARRSALLVQVDATHAQQSIVRALQPNAGEDTFSTFERLSSQVSDERHKAIAMEELAHDPVEEAFLVTEEHAALEQDLRDLKHEYSSLDVPPTPKALEDSGGVEE